MLRHLISHKILKLVRVPTGSGSMWAHFLHCLFVHRRSGELAQKLWESSLYRPLDYCLLCHTGCFWPQGAVAPYFLLFQKPQALCMCRKLGNINDLVWKSFLSPLWLLKWSSTFERKTFPEQWHLPQCYMPSGSMDKMSQFRFYRRMDR